MFGAGATPLSDALDILPVVGIARRCPAAAAPVVAAAAAEAGLRAVEITMDASDAAQAIAAARQAAPGLVVGAGTVGTVAAARDAMAAGAAFLVSPGFEEDVVRFGLSAGVDVIPGVMTPTEISHASRLVSMVKLFPAGSLGPAYLRSVREPFAGVAFMCTGGIDAANARAFLDAGARAVGIGGSAFPAAALQSADGAAIGAAVAAVVAAVSERA